MARAQELFKKVEAYNEIAELMMTQKARIYFADTTYVCCFGEHFTSYSEFRKYIRREYIKEVADQILSGDWEFDKEVTIGRSKFEIELVA